MNLALEYLFWHFATAPKKLLRITANYLIFFVHYFSVGLLIKTLFAPWKRQLIGKGEPGFSLTDVLNTLSFNLISRFIGTIIRFFVILTWLLVEIFTLIFGVLFAIVWIFLPPVTLPLFFLLREKTDPAAKLLKRNETSAKNIFSFLVKTPLGAFLFKRLGITPLEIDQFLLSATDDNLTSIYRENHDSSALFVALTRDWPALREFLFNKEIKPEDVLAICQWFTRIEEEKNKVFRFWTLENLLTQRGVGKDWAYGYTPTLDQYTEELTKKFDFTHHLVGRAKETRAIEQVLSRAGENNVILVGEPGIGRKTIVLEFARKINEGRIYPALARKRVLLLNLGSLLASSNQIMVAEEKIGQIFKEAASAGNIILVIENFDQYLRSEKDKVDLSRLFGQYASGPSLQVIGITTPEDFQKYIYPKTEIAKIFEKISVSQPSTEEAITILLDTLPYYEKRSGVFVLYQAAVETVKKADQYINEIPFPEKAIDLLDNVCVYSGEQGIKVVTPKEVNTVLSQKTSIPLGQIETSEKEKLVNLEEFLHQRIIGQDEAVREVANAMRRGRLGISKQNKPLGTFLFLGPTGVGKTETAKALAECYFGNENKMLRFDMSEYQGEDGLTKVLGSSSTRDPGQIATQIRQSPFSLLLLDEIEKARGEVLNVFLTMIDEGYFTDAFGRRVDCRNLIIIGTSNAGSEFIRQNVNRYPTHEEFQKQVIDFVLKQGLFSPEFINRFDATVVYRPLTSPELKEIARLLLAKLNSRLKDKDLSVKITDELVNQVATLGFDPTFGARPMQRVIQDKIEDQIAQKILKGETKRGEEIEISI